MGRDELMPLTLDGRSVFGDLGAMLVDSLDTLWMMGLKPEFDRCLQTATANLCFVCVLLPPQIYGSAEFIIKRPPRSSQEHSPCRRHVPHQK